MVKTTKEQRKALLRKYVHGDLNAKGITYLKFRRTVQPTFGMDNAIAVPWCGMWLAVERDGYTHS